MFRKLLFIFASVGLLGLNFRSEVTAGERVFVESDQTLVVFSDMTIPEGKTYDSVVVVGGSLNFSGQTDTLVVIGGKTHLTSSAVVSKELVLIGGSVSHDEGAQVPSPTEKLSIAAKNLGEEIGQAVRETFKNFSWASLGSSLWSFLTLPLIILVALALSVVVLGAAVVLFFLAPSFSRRADSLLRNSPILSMLWGLIAFLAFAPVMILMILSIIGILAIPFYVLFVLLLAFSGLIAGCRGMGSFLLRDRAGDRSLLSTFIGCLAAIALCFVPYVGQMALTLVWLAGTGALLRSFFIRDEDMGFIDVEFASRPSIS